MIRTRSLILGLLMLVSLGLISCQDDQQPQPANAEDSADQPVRKEGVSTEVEEDSLIFEDRRDTISANLKVLREGTQWLTRDEEVATAIKTYFEEQAYDTVRHFIRYTQLEAELSSQGISLMEQVEGSLSQLGYAGEALTQKKNHFQAVYDQFTVSSDDGSETIKPGIWVPYYHKIWDTQDWDGKQVREICQNAMLPGDTAKTYYYNPGSDSFSARTYTPNQSDSADYHETINWHVHRQIPADYPDEYTPFHIIGGCHCRAYPSPACSNGYCATCETGGGGACGIHAFGMGCSGQCFFEAGQLEGSVL